DSPTLRRLLFPQGWSLRPHARRSVPHVPNSEPRRARAAASAASGTALIGHRRRGALCCLDYGAVDDEREPPAGPPEEEGGAEQRPDGFGRQWQPRLYVAIVLLALLIAYSIAFVLENDKQISVHFVLATARTSLIWVILLSVAIGLLLGVLFSQLPRRRRRRH